MFCGDRSADDHGHDPLRREFSWCRPRGAPPTGGRFWSRQPATVPLRPAWFIAKPVATGPATPLARPHLCLRGQPSKGSKSIMTPRTPQNPESQQALGKTIRELRSKKGDSLEALAGKAGITKNMLSLIERGEGNPSWSTMRGIAKALGVPVAELAKRAEASEK
jgi:DNA-binding XRE family transcriptional regulator